jgi:hypothetical protein
MNNIFSSDNIFDKHIAAKEQEELLERAVDFCGIFDVLYELFDKLGVLNEGSVSNNGISFRLAYPDYAFNDETESAVVYTLHTRRRLQLKTSAGNISQEKSRELVSQKDIITGQIKSIHSNSFENYISLTIYCSTNERLYQTIKYVETVMTKYSGYLQQYFRKVIYEGMTSESSAPNLFKNRMMSRTLHFQILTEEMFSLLHEEIQEINTQHVNPKKF